MHPIQKTHQYNQNRRKLRLSGEEKKNSLIFSEREKILHPPNNYRMLFLKGVMTKKALGN